MVLVNDQETPCPYLPGFQARLPLEWPRTPLSPERLDALLALGYRRSGHFFYRTRCPECQACQPTRIAVGAYVPSRSMRRVLERGDQKIRVAVHEPILSEQRLQLVNAHRNQRGLAHGTSWLDEEDYRGFLIETNCTTWEMVYRIGDRLVAVGVVDVGKTSLSAVYCYFDPNESKLSLGSYNILKLFELARDTGRRYVYLGMYVEANRHLNYKGRFLPQERLVNGIWQEVTKGL